MTNDIELGLTLRNILMGINIQAPQVIICVEKRENNKCFVTVNLGSRVQIVAQENKLIITGDVNKINHYLILNGLKEQDIYLSKVPFTNLLNSLSKSNYLTYRQKTCFALSCTKEEDEIKVITYNEYEDYRNGVVEGFND